MKKVVKHGLWMATGMVTLPLVAVMAGITGDKKEITKVTDGIAMHASKISKKLNEKDEKES